jgi:putative NADH-flavin reductase
MKVALIGASGTLGSRILEELLSRGHQVTGIVRNPENLAPRGKLTVHKADAGDADQLKSVLPGHDAVVTAIPFFGFATEELLAGIEASGVKRVLVSGTAGSLEVEPRIQYISTSAVSEHGRPEHLDSREAYKLLRKQDQLEWTYLAPAALLTPGRRTGTFRLGTDQLLKDRVGESRISMEDLAIVIADELENPRHIRRRFTAAY